MASFFHEQSRASQQICFSRQIVKKGEFNKSEDDFETPEVSKFVCNKDQTFSQRFMYDSTFSWKLFLSKAMYNLTILYTA